MGDVPVHGRPVPVGGRVLPGVDDQLQAALQQGLGVGEHPVGAADAQVVEARRGTRHPAQDAVALGVLVGRAEHRRGGAGPERQGGELGHEVVAADVVAQQPLDGGVLDVVGVLAVDDDGVAHLARLDHGRGQAHAVDEAEAGVGDVEVHGGRRQPEAVVQAHRDRRLQVLARHGRVDEQPDVGGVDAGGVQRLVAGGDGRGVGVLPRGPVAAFVDAGDALEEAGGQPEPLHRGAETLLDLGGRRDPGGQPARDGEQRDVGEPGGGVS